MSGHPKRLRVGLVLLLAVVAALCFGAFARRRVSGTDRVPAADTSASAAAGDFSAGTARFEFPSRLRVGTYNLHNFRDENRFSEKGKFQYKRPKPEKEKRALCRTILEARPDVLAVQEIGGEAWLDELAESLARRGLEYPYRALLKGDDKFNQLAVLSRVPFSQTIEIAAPRKLTRGLLGVVVPVRGGKNFYVYVVHLKSKVSSDPDDPECARRRLREARCVRRLIDFRADGEKAAEKIPAAADARVPESLKKSPPELFALVGDFNDDPASPPLRPLEAASFARALPARDSAGGVFSYVNPRQGYFHAFDRILVSPEVYAKHYVPASAKIADFPWAADASDHRLVYADFDFTGTLRRSRGKENGKEKFSEK